MFFAVRHQEIHESLHPFFLGHKAKCISWQINTYPTLLSHHRLELCPIFIVLERSHASVSFPFCELVTLTHKSLQAKTRVRSFGNVNHYVNKNTW